MVPFALKLNAQLQLQLQLPPLFPGAHAPAFVGIGVHPAPQPSVLRTFLFEHSSTFQQDFESMWFACDVNRTCVASLLPGFTSGLSVHCCVAFPGTQARASILSLVGGGGDGAMQPVAVHTQCRGECTHAVSLRSETHGPTGSSCGATSSATIRSCSVSRTRDLADVRCRNSSAMMASRNVASRAAGAASQRRSCQCDAPRCRRAVVRRAPRRRAR